MNAGFKTDDSSLVWAKSIVATALEIELSEIPDDASIYSLDSWDSLGHMRIIEQVELSLERDLETETLLEIMDVASLAALNPERK
jgi:acyl carrier protein